MSDENYINLMDMQQIQKVVDNSIITYQKYLIVKSNDDRNITFDILKSNQDAKFYTVTPSSNWLTFEFRKMEKLAKIIGTFYYFDQRTYSYECEYLDIKKQWVPFKTTDCQKDLILEFDNTIIMRGIRFRGKNTVDPNLQFINLNFYAIRKQIKENRNSSKELQVAHDQKEIVNIVEYQPFYRFLNNKLIACFKPVVVCKFNSSNFRIEDITNNKVENVYQTSQNWLTYEFLRKYKLSQIQILLCSADKRVYQYELQIMDKNKNWLQVEVAQDRYKHINVKFLDNKSAYGIRIKGKSNFEEYIAITSISIFAERGSPYHE